MEPVDLHSVGQQNFEWIVNAVAELAVKKAQETRSPQKDYRWGIFLNGEMRAASSAEAPKQARKQTAYKASAPVQSKVI